MEKIRRKKAESQWCMQMLLPLLGLLATVKGSLLDLVISSGLGMLQVMLAAARSRALSQQRELGPVTG